MTDLVTCDFSDGVVGVTVAVPQFREVDSHSPTVTRAILMLNCALGVAEVPNAEPLLSDAHVGPSLARTVELDRHASLNSEVVHRTGGLALHVIRDCFLSGHGIQARLHLLASATYAWGVTVAIGLASGLIVAITSAVARSGVSREVGDPVTLWKPLLLLLGGSAYAVLLGFAFALILGSQRFAVVVHTTMLVLLPTVAAASDSMIGRFLACALPAAPVWGWLGEGEVGPMALDMTASATVISAAVWAGACSCTMGFSLRHLGGLSIAAWVRGM
ncbi:hypothetical protein JK386_17635 [Nocardioides sp. zg-536]|uniref:Uncharacterized protein n=1 Tax=Nocardioides faecalis TaxID=2803858 RepID=A0A938YD76_9ACTN|nr:hypothetical protein [Nocardioides faecalis]MBM9461719.1 hypothetical protein [Nocardioides faecalis]QVI59915.1 hypothetical protein KG111_06250 [Nocardioides faecalis]